jgi:hypothetical protein
MSDKTYANESGRRQNLEENHPHSVLITAITYGNESVHI